MTTTSCLLNKNRNKGLSKSRIERYRREYYGQRHVIWLREGIEGDDTDGHIDELARFVELPMPHAIAYEGQRVPATYVNFYFANGALLVPTFGQRDRDRQAIRILQAHFSDREVIGVDCRKLIWGLGAIHCFTQQQPLF